jgi:phosphoglucosamine mutase
MTRYPQVLHNIRVEAPIANLDEALKAAVSAEEEALGADGRVLVRASGTEPLIRVMVEAAEADVAEATALRLGAAVEAIAGAAR